MEARNFLGLTAACFATAGCALQQAPFGVGILSDAARSEIRGEWSGSHDGGAVVPGWIRTFDDSELTRLVEEGIARNPDLAAAAARVEASWAGVRIAAGALYPRAAVKALGERQGLELEGDLGLDIDPPTLGSLGVDQSGGSGSTRSSESSSQRWIYGIGAGASWELDLWGRVRSKKAAAVADSEALEADLEFARQSLAAQVARAYFSAIEAGQQAANAQETLHLYQEDLKLTGERQEQGFASDFDLAQVRSRVAAAEDTLYAAQSARAQAIRAIEVITGYYPAGITGVGYEFPGGLGRVPAGLPAQLLERRPDLIAAERRFAAAFHRVNEARTARLPRISISGIGGISSAELDSVGVLDSVNWGLASGIVQPIFFGGELKAAQDLRTAEQKAAAADYTGAALQAFADVEDALSNEHFLRLREGALSAMAESSAQAVVLGRQQLDQGQTDMFTILRLTGENLAARIELTKVRASRLRERADLHLALGGDFRGLVK